MSSSTSKPVIPGICTSRKSSSGLSLSICVTASLPLEASPTTSISGKVSRYSVKSSRASFSSSTIRQVVLLLLFIHLFFLVRVRFYRVDSWLGNLCLLCKNLRNTLVGLSVRAVGNPARNNFSIACLCWTCRFRLRFRPLLFLLLNRVHCLSLKKK